MPRRARTSSTNASRVARQSPPPYTGIRFSIIGGHAGAGKSTLVKHLLLHSGSRRVAALVQDTAAFEFERSQVAYQNLEIVQLTNGNALCSLARGFSTALYDVTRRTGAPEHVLIEADTRDDLLNYVRYARDEGLSRDAALVVADADRLRWASSTQVMRQLHQADFLLLNKVDLLTKRQLLATREWLRENIPSPRWLETVHANAPVSLLIGPPLDCVAPHPSPCAEGHESWSGCDIWCIETRCALDRDHLHAMVRALPEGVVRGDGVVCLTDKPGGLHRLQIVGRRVILDPDQSQSTSGPDTRIAFMGIAGGTNPGVLAQTVRGALRNDFALLAALGSRSRESALAA